MKPKAENRAQSNDKENNSGLNRVTYDADARIALDKIVDKVRNGHEELEVDRNEVAQYLLMNCARLLVESDIQEIRAQCFSEKDSLLNLAKRASSDADLPESIRKALREHYGISATAKKKKSKDDVNAERPSAMTTVG